MTGGKGLTLPLVTEEELKIMLDEGGKAGAIEVEKVKMIKNVFQLKDITAEDAMTPRLYVFSLDGNLRLKEAQELLYNSKYSRIPVYDGTLDNITGILYKSRALTELAKNQTDAKLKEIAYPPHLCAGREDGRRSDEAISAGKAAHGRGCERIRRRHGHCDARRSA